MKKVFWLVSLLMMVANSAFPQSGADFFPLRIGNQWKYQYTSLNRQYLDISYVSQVTTEAGTVQYAVLGQSVQDTATVWNIFEIDSISTQIFDHDNRLVTSSVRRAEWNFLLYEYSNSTHKIRSAAVYPPFTFPGLWQYSSNGDIYRYGADSSHRLIKRLEYFDGMRKLTDTLLFKKDVGLIHAHEIYEKGPNVPQYLSWNAELIELLTGVDRMSSQAPDGFGLTQNYPNPCNPSTEIRFTLPERSRVALTIVNILGQSVATLVSEELPAGTHTRRWNAAGLPSGVYFYRLEVGRFSETKRLVVVK